MQKVKIDAICPCCHSDIRLSVEIEAIHRVRPKPAIYTPPVSYPDDIPF